MGKIQDLSSSETATHLTRQRCSVIRISNEKVVQKPDREMMPSNSIRTRCLAFSHAKSVQQLATEMMLSNIIHLMHIPIVTIGFITFQHRLCLCWRVSASVLIVLSAISIGFDCIITYQYRVRLFYHISASILIVLSDFFLFFQKTKQVITESFRHFSIKCKTNAQNAFPCAYAILLSYCIEN